MNKFGLDFNLQESKIYVKELQKNFEQYIKNLTQKYIYLKDETKIREEYNFYENLNIKQKRTLSI